MVRSRNLFCNNSSLLLADLAGKLTIMLDKRVLKTPEGHPISIPASKRVLASIVAQEWEAQDKVTKHYALPAVGAPSYFALIFASSVLRWSFPIDFPCMQGFRRLRGRRSSNRQVY
jgi:hypothetical protein